MQLLVKIFCFICVLWWRENNITTTGFSVNNGIRRSSFIGPQISLVRNERICAAKERKGSTSLKMFLGSDGGILGVGGPEVAIIVLAGYFLLGPTELFKATKEIGKIFNSLRTISSEAAKNFESTMENQLELQEIRKAQQELNDAFSFRRSINSSSEPSNWTTGETEQTSSSSETVSENSSDTDVVRKKIKRRRKVVKKKPMPEEDEEADVSPEYTSSYIPELEMPSKPQEDFSTSDDWFVDKMNPVTSELASTSPSSLEQNRFQQQISGQWNDNIIENTDKLSPLSKIMEQLAILDEERMAAEKRLEEEFKLRTEMDEKFYNQKRALLEETAIQVQTSVFNSQIETSNSTSTLVDDRKETHNETYTTIQNTTKVTQATPIEATA